MSATDGVTDHNPRPLMERALDHIDLLHRLAALLKQDPAEAADLVTETYVWASGNLDSYRPREVTLRAWLLRSLVRTAGARGPGGRSRSAAAPGARALDRMLPVHRTLLLLWSVGRLSYQEMAAVLNLTVDTVVRHLHHARDVAARQLAAGTPGRPESSPMARAGHERAAGTCRSIA